MKKLYENLSIKVCIMESSAEIIRTSAGEDFKDDIFLEFN